MTHDNQATQYLSLIDNTFYSATKKLRIFKKAISICLGHGETEKALEIIGHQKQNFNKLEQLVLRRDRKTSISQILIWAKTCQANQIFEIMTPKLVYDVNMGIAGLDFENNEEQSFEYLQDLSREWIVKSSNPILL